MAQLPLAHVAVAFARLHPTPQPPQLVSVLSGVSQPFDTTPSQLPQPVAHETIWQLPVPHVEVA